MSATLIVSFTSALAIAVVVWIVVKDAPRLVRSLRRGVRVTGYIARDDTVPFRYGSLHFPVIIFRDDSGVSHEVKTRYQKATSAREQMAEVKIAYLPQDPEKTAVLVGLKFYLPTIANAAFFVSIAGAIPALLWWAQR